MQRIYNDSPGAKDSEPDEEVFHVHHFPDALVIIKEPGKSTTTNIPVVDSTPIAPDKNHVSLFIPYFVVCTFIFLTLSSILFQLYIIIHPPTTTIVLMLKSQTVSLSDSIRTGRVIPPITLSQSQSAPTTGRGHQDARAAQGTLTFYNGQPAQQFVPAGTQLTGADGVLIATSQDATIPEANLTANPPIFGQTTIPAKAVSVGDGSNKQAYDINETCCATSVVAKNTSSFYGGQ